MTPSSSLADPIQASPPSSGSGSRFRPYASPNHHVTKGRYITSNDHRGYIPVYEYPLNGQWIMMDIDDGYILWTGIWKALGNSKADIVKMIDSQPDLAPLIRRVRGGYLKIQGTWMPYEVALRLSRRVAYNIRDDLVPLFGPTFPSTCLSPDQPGYGQVVSNGPNRRRPRRTAPGNSTTSPSGDSWTVVTPALPTNSRHLPSSGYPPISREPSHHYQHPSPSIGLRPPPGRISPTNPASASPRDRDRTVSVRYSPYLAPAPYPGRRSPIDIPSLPGRQHGPYSADVSGLENNIKLPPIQTPLHSEKSPSYALPPISAMEDLRGIDTHDSAAVLRRLKSDDGDSFAEPRIRFGEVGSRSRSRSFSSQSCQYARNVRELRPHGPSSWRSPSSHSYSRSPSDSDIDECRPPSSRLSLSVPSNTSADGNSTCDPSPVSPTTPRSALSMSYPGLLPHAQPKDRRRDVYPSSAPPTDWAPRQYMDSRPPAARRHSDADSSESHPHRPW